MGTIEVQPAKKEEKPVTIEVQPAKKVGLLAQALKPSKEEAQPAKTTLGVPEASKGAQLWAKLRKNHPLSKFNQFLAKMKVKKEKSQSPVPPAASRSQTN